MTHSPTSKCYRYRLTLKDRLISSISLEGVATGKFAFPATKKDLPKLYVVKHEDKVVYIGFTTQSIRTRLRQGLQAKGKGGYHGYRWKDLSEVEFFVWCFPGLTADQGEFLEAELVYRIRHATGKWPEYQTEIHFRNMPLESPLQEILNQVYGQIGSL